MANKGKKLNVGQELRRVENEMEDEARQLEIEVDKELDERLNPTETDSPKMVQMVDHDANPATPPQEKPFIKEVESEPKTEEKSSFVSVKSPAYLYDNQVQKSRLEPIGRVLPKGSRLEVLERFPEGRWRVRFNTQSNAGRVEGFVDPKLVEDMVD